MIDERLFKIFGKKEYEELKKYKKIIGKTGLILIPPALILSFNPTLSAILFGSSAISLATSKYISDNKIENYSKEVLEIKKIYEEIIKDYVKMNKILSLKEPVEIHEVYMHMLKNGYLSNNRQFEKENIKSTIFTILGAYILSGKGMCRHISTMEKDIMKKAGIECSVLNLYQKPVKDSIRDEILDQQMLEMVKRMNMPSNMTEKNNKEKESYRYIEELEVKKQSNEKHGNHAIVLAIKGGKLNLLDAMQERIYKKNTENPMVLVDDETDNNICIGKTVFFGTKKEYNKQQKEILLEETTKEEDKKLMEQAKKIIFENEDIFGKFYKEHNDIYQDVTEKIKKIERKKWN